MLGHERADLLFHLHVRHHFARNLAESREAVRDADESGFVDGGDVTRDVPTVAEHVARLAGLAEVTDHPVRSFHEQQAFTIEQRPFQRDRVHDLCDDSRQWMPDRSGLPAALPLAPMRDVRHAHGHDRRHLGAAVPFEQVDAELLLERGRHRFAEFFRTDNRVTEMRELLFVAFPDIRRGKRRRGDDERPTILERELADRLRIHRIGMVNHAEAGNQRQPQRAGEAERMEERQHAEHDVLSCELKELTGRVDVREHVAMRQHHALGYAGAAARKDDRGQRVGAALAEVHAVDCPGGQGERQQKQAKSLDGAELPQHVFEKHHAVDRFDSRFREEDFRGQDRPDLTSVDGDRDRFPAGGEVQVHRHLARQGRRDVRERAADRRRQQQTDVRVVRRVAADPSREQQAGHEGIAKCQPALARIGHAEREPLMLRGPNELSPEGLIGRPARRGHVGSQFHHRQARFGRGRG